MVVSRRSGRVEIRDRFEFSALMTSSQTDLWSWYAIEEHSHRLG
jgi:hypothetical protein